MLVVNYRHILYTMQMYRFDRSVFKAYDIRGTSGKNLAPILYRKLGEALGTKYKGKSKVAVVAYDHREESSTYAWFAASALEAKGFTTALIGPISTPQLCYLALSNKAGISVMVTGSHNSSEQNGAKLYFDSIPLSASDIAEMGEAVAKSTDKYTPMSIPSYDFALDSDGDRITLRFNGAKLTPYTLGLYLAIMRSSKKVIVDDRFPEVFKTALKQIKFIKSKPGHSNIKRLANKIKADFGIEFSGHVYHPFDDVLVDSGFHAASSVLQSDLTFGNLAEFLSSIPEVYFSEELKVKKPKVKKTVIKKFKNGAYVIRNSNTENCVKILAHATSYMSMEAYFKMAKERLKNER